jgi:type IV secretory pathway VirB4 component
VNPLKPKKKSVAAGEGMPSPAALSVTPWHVQVGDGYAATYAVCGYPAEVGPAWLDPLLSYPGRVDVAVHMDPVPPQLAAPMLKRQRARLESSRRLDADHAGVKSAAASVLLDLQPATFRHQQGWLTTLPVGVDPLRMRRILDTTALAAAFPLASADLAAPAPGIVAPPEGVLYGVNTTSNGVLIWNRWAQDNHNSVVLARSGAGKSYFVKLEVLRSLYQGTTVSVIDPEDEYAPLAEHVGGTVVQLGQPGVRINPLDLPADNRADTLTRRGLYLHTLISVMLGAPPPPAEKAALDRAITATYAKAGINGDPATWTKPAPLLRDLAEMLAAEDDPAAGQLAARLAPWTIGNFASLFDGPTTTTPRGHLVVWSLRHLPDELRTVGTLLALDSIWSGIDAPAMSGRRRRQLVVVDEAWLLMRDGEGARFLFRMAKAARKRSAGLCVITQDAADVLSTDLGLAVVSNAATQVLMRQSTQSIDAVSEAFNLTAGESRLLLSAPRGEGLLVAGRSRIPFRSVGSAAEHKIAVTGLGFDGTGLDS